MKKGFTLVELMIVVVALALLFAVAIVYLGQAKSRSRDAKKISDVQAMHKALEMYHYDHGAYPSTLTFGAALTDGTKTYMHKLPTYPTPADGDCTLESYTYEQAESGASYNLYYCLGGEVNKLTSGNKVAVPTNYARASDGPPDSGGSSCSSWTFTKVSTESGIYPAVEYMGNSTYLFIPRSSGGNQIETYTIESDGSLTYVDSLAIDYGWSNSDFWATEDYVMSAHGSADIVTIFSIAADGTLTKTGEISTPNTVYSVASDNSKVWYGISNNGVKAAKINADGSLTLQAEQGGYNLEMAEDIYVEPGYNFQYTAEGVYGYGYAIYATQGSLVVRADNYDPCSPFYVWADEGDSVMFGTCYGGLYAMNTENGFISITVAATGDAAFDDAEDVWGDADNNLVYAKDSDTGNLKIFSYDSSGNITLLDTISLGVSGNWLWSNDTYIYTGWGDMDVISKTCND